MIDDQPDKDHPDFWRQRVDAELAREPQSEGRIADIGFLVGRFVTRLARIVGGAAILWAVWMGLDKAGQILSKPFSALSPLELLGGIAIGVACLWGISIALIAAFGRGVTRQEHNKQKNEARRKEMFALLMEQEHIKDQQKFNAGAIYTAMYSVGRFIGRLRSFIRQNTK